jgi:hypothetical protein
MMASEVVQERWACVFLSTQIYGSNVREGGAWKKTIVYFWVETEVLQSVFNNKKGGLS